MSAAPPAALKALVDNMGCEGCYGIEWANNDGLIECKSYYNPQWRIDAVAAKGMKGLYTTHSTKFTFRVGEGVVGKVFQQQKLLFSADLQELTAEGIAAAMQGWDSLEFARADLAKDFGIRSAVFLPTADGVLEFGSTNKVESLPTFISDEAKGIIEANHRPVYVVEWEEHGGKIVPVGHHAPEVPPSCQLESALYGSAVQGSDGDGRAPDALLVQAMRERRVQNSSGEHTLARLFGQSQAQSVFWPVPGSRRVIEVAFVPTGNNSDGRSAAGLRPNVCSLGLSAACRLLQAPIALEWRRSGDEIVCAGHYNSEERVSKCDEKFGGSRYTLESYGVTFKVGEGVVGRAYASKESSLIPDLLQMPPESFKRQKLAEKFNVRTAVFLAVQGGDGEVECVLEICTDHVCQMFEADISKSELVPKSVQTQLASLAAPGMNSIY